MVGGIVVLVVVVVLVLVVEVDVVVVDDDVVVGMVEVVVVGAEVVVVSLASLGEQAEATSRTVRRPARLRLRLRATRPPRLPDRCAPPVFFHPASLPKPEPYLRRPR